MPLNSAHDEPFDRAILDGRLPSIAAVFRDRLAKDPDGTAWAWFEPDPAPDAAPGAERLVSWTWAQVGRAADEWAAGLLGLGVQVEDCVAVAAATSVRWALADLAIMLSGGATTTVYPTTLAEDVAFILSDSGSTVVFADDASQVEKLRAVRDAVPQVRQVVVLHGEGSEDGWVITGDQLAERGRAALAKTPRMLDERIAQIRPEHLATIIYTSGTTGRPKGAELTQDCLVYEGAAVDSIGLVTKDDRQFLWLPLSHVMGKLLLSLAYQIGFPTAIDGRVDKIVDHLEVVRPTFMGAAPRVFEKAHAKIALVLAEGSPTKQKMVQWALATGEKMSQTLERGETPSPQLRAQHAIADKLVLAKVRARFGGRIRFFISGSAPLSPEIARWFGSVGLLILEGYGLSETSSASVVNRPVPGSYAFGSCGWPVPGNALMVADDGELLMKGPGVMRGYRNDPELTERVFTDGWFHTGDIGTIDERGFVRVTDRKKDVFKTSNGKYVAPANIEVTFKGLCPYVSQFIVEGAGRSFVTAVVTLDADSMRGWAKENGKEQLAYADLTRDPAVKELIQGYVDELNLGLNRWEQVKRFVILPRDLSVEQGELTPSLKLKRAVVKERFRSDIEGLYAAPSER